jgi:S-adenosylmethionine:tRNA ribosyltransferase-isomerase
MRAAELDYELPPHLIAHHPAEKRTGSRMMVVRAGAARPFPVGTFAETFLEQLRPDDLVVANDSRVLHARLQVTRPGGGTGELLLLEPVAPEENRWRAMARPARRLQPGMELSTAMGGTLLCVERESSGDWVVQLPVEAAKVEDWLLEHGQVPLPPYIEANGQPPDRYQTVYSDIAGSVAAPTAGLHFDDELWMRLQNEVEVATVTLHVGAGTFQPIRVDDLDEHDMHSERYSIDEATDSAIRQALGAGRRIVAVGTTSTRVLESVYGPAGGPLNGTSRLLIQPGYRFECVGALLTNFHLPRSTLLALVMALAGDDTIHAAYSQAIADEMRFFSFGDAMFIHGGAA